MSIKFLSLETIRLAQDAIGFLNNYKSPEVIDEKHIVGENAIYENRDVEMTELLEELGKINVRREEIISKFMKKN